MAKITDADDLFWNIMFRMRKMLEELTSITDETKVDYLKPIINLARHQGRLCVATLNYDNGIELVSRANGIACDTGIESWNRRGVFEFPNDGIQLIKLHGSNYWSWTYDVTTYSERFPRRLIRVKSHFDEKQPMTVAVESAMVIFGRNKLTVEGPFLELLKQFDEQLRQIDILTVVGYSFRDTHINFYFSKFVDQYGGKMRIVDPNFESSGAKYVEYLRKPRDTKPDQIEIIEKCAADALKELYPH